MSRARKLLKKAVILGTTLSVVASVSGLIHSTETKARGRSSKIRVKANGNTPKRPVTNGTQKPEENKDTQYTKDFIPPPMSLYDKNNDKGRSSRNTPTPPVIISISTNK